MFLEEKVMISAIYSLQLSKIYTYIYMCVYLHINKSNVYIIILHILYIHLFEEWDKTHRT